MSPSYLFLLHFTVLAYALIGGVFLAFSDFIMRALSLTSGQGGAEAMQVINREVFRWVFMALFLGLAALSLILSIHAAIGITGPAAVLIGAAGLVYLVGCFAVTAVFNVPMNEALAGMDLSQDTTLAYWTHSYLPRWTFWNTVRTVACCLSSALLLVGLTLLYRAQAV